LGLELQFGEQPAKPRSFCSAKTTGDLSFVACLVIDFAFRITHTRDNVLYGLFAVFDSWRSYNS